MNPQAETVLLTLLHNGNSLSSLYEECKNGKGALDWGRFEQRVIKDQLVQKILGIGTAEIDAALAEVRAERERLRATWRGKTMPGEVVERLSMLSDIGMELADSKLEVGLTPHYVTWMMDKALPVLKTAMHIVL